VELFVGGDTLIALMEGEKFELQENINVSL
jgi:hypothetical protein